MFARFRKWLCSWLCPCNRTESSTSLPKILGKVYVPAPEHARSAGQLAHILRAIEAGNNTPEVREAFVKHCEVLIKAGVQPPETVQEAVELRRKLAQ